MTTSTTTLPSLSIAWQSDHAQQCDPDFAFPTEEVRYRVPLWIVGAVALACASLMLSRSA